MYHLDFIGLIKSSTWFLWYANSFPSFYTERCFKHVKDAAVNSVAAGAASLQGEFAEADLCGSMARPHGKGLYWGTLGSRVDCLLPKFMASKFMLWIGRCITIAEGLSASTSTQEPIKAQH